MDFTLNDERIEKDLKSHYLEKIDDDQFESHQMKGGGGMAKNQELLNYVFCFEHVYFYIIIGSE